MQRKSFSPSVRVQIAVEAIKGLKTVNEISKEFDCSPSQVSEWKRQLIEGGVEIFSPKRDRKGIEHEVEKDRLLKQIGQLTVENDWMKKKYEEALQRRANKNVR